MSTADLQDKAQEQVTVGNETLSIQSVYVWENSMPGIATKQGRKGIAAHIALTIQRTPTNASSASSTDVKQPVVHALHVIRTEPTSSSATTSAKDDSFTWRAPPDFINPSEEAIGKGVYSGESLLKSDIRPDLIEISGWNGPRFGEDAGYVVVAELAGGVLLKSKPEKIQSVC